MAMAVSLIVALTLGLLSDVTVAAFGRGSARRGVWWEPLRGIGTDLRLLVVRRDRASLAEAVWAGLALLGGTLAAAASIGAAPGSAPLLYLSLAGAAVGGHAVASFSDIAAVEDRAARARLQFALAEPAFLLALSAGFVRWRAADLQVVRGAHDVLGSGLEVGPPMAAAGLLLAALVIVAAGALRLAPERGTEPGAGGGGALILTLCRWSLAGATALAAGAFLVGGGGDGLIGGWPLHSGVVPLLLAAVVGAVVLGGARMVVVSLPPAIRPLAGWAAGLAAAVALELVFLA
jgi:hypothetical protein